jgi:hypothetical protein
MVGMVLLLVVAVEREYGEKVIMVMVEQMFNLMVVMKQLVVEVVQYIGWVDNVKILQMGVG